MEVVGTISTGIATETQEGNAIPAFALCIMDENYGSIPNTVLKNLTFPLSITTIGNSAFDGCTNLTSISVSWTGEADSNIILVSNNTFPSEFLSGNTKQITIPNGKSAVYNAVTG